MGRNVISIETAFLFSFLLIEQEQNFFFSFFWFSRKKKFFKKSWIIVWLRKGRHMLWNHAILFVTFYLSKLIFCCHNFLKWNYHQFLNTLDTTHSNIHEQQTGWNTPQGFMLYLSTNFETRYLLSSCSNQSIDKNFRFLLKFMLKVASSVFRNRFKLHIFIFWRGLLIEEMSDHWHL